MRVTICVCVCVCACVCAFRVFCACVIVAVERDALSTAKEKLRKGHMDPGSARH